MKLIVARHGESSWNAEGRFQGRLDPPLSEKGRRQAQALARALGPEGLQAAASSPLLRALETARVWAQACSRALRVDEDLTEISHGDWEGKLRTEVAERWPDLLAAWRSQPHTVRFPNGESLGEVDKRFSSFLERAPAYGSALLVITHDVIARLAVMRALRKPLSAFNDLHVENAAINEFSLDGGELKAVRVNSVAHLESIRSNPLVQAL